MPHVGLLYMIVIVALPGRYHDSYKKASEYDQIMPQIQTTDYPTIPRTISSTWQQEYKVNLKLSNQPLFPSANKYIKYCITKQ